MTVEQSGEKEFQTKFEILTNKFRKTKRKWLQLKRIAAYFLPYDVRLIYFLFFYYFE